MASAARSRHARNRRAKTPDGAGSVPTSVKPRQRIPRRVRLVSLRTMQQSRGVRFEPCPRHGWSCSLAQDFSFNLAPHVIPGGRAGIQCDTPALVFSGRRCFDLACFTVASYIQAFDQAGGGFRPFLLGETQRILQDFVYPSSHGTHCSTGREANQTASGDKGSAGCPVGSTGAILSVTGRLSRGRNAAGNTAIRHRFRKQSNRRKTPMADQSIRFDDGAAYERFIG